MERRGAEKIDGQGDESAFSIWDLPSLSQGQRMVAATLRASCPHCGCGRLYDGLYRLHRACPTCGIAFQRNGGEWTGPLCIGITLGSIAGILFWSYFFATGRDFAGIQWVAALVSTATVLVSYRFIKGWWIWLLYATGFLYPEATPDRATLRGKGDPPS